MYIYIFDHQQIILLCLDMRQVSESNVPKQSHGHQSFNRPSHRKKQLLRHTFFFVELGCLISSLECLTWRGIYVLSDFAYKTLSFFSAWYITLQKSIVVQDRQEGHRHLTNEDDSFMILMNSIANSNG